MSSMFVTEGNLVRIIEYEYHNSCLLISSYLSNHYWIVNHK